jgi:hypothetical protein
MGGAWCSGIRRSCLSGALAAPKLAEEAQASDVWSRGHRLTPGAARAIPIVKQHGKRRRPVFGAE